MRSFQDQNFIGILQNGTQIKQYQMLGTEKQIKKEQSNKKPPCTMEEILEIEMIRISIQQTQASITKIWKLSEEQVFNNLCSFKSLPQSKISPIQLMKQLHNKLIRQKNKIYLGAVLNKKKHGKGITLYEDGKIYEGEYLENEKSGFGCQMYENGNYYFGEYSQNKKHGFGCFYWFSLCEPACTPNEKQKIEHYQGDWWGGLPDGQGRHQKNNGDLYYGKFKNGLKHGKGHEYFANGDEYQGQYVNGFPEGYGEYKWVDGSSYKGDFKQGYRNGYGVWRSQGGKEKYQGHYLIDRKHGFGIYEWETGQIYKGNYLEDVRQGEGELYIRGNLQYKGWWENGKQMKKQKIRQIVEIHASKTQKISEQEDNEDFQSQRNFRVKTSKIKSRPKRQLSAVSTRVNKYKIKQSHIEKNKSTNTCSHRGCSACKQSSPGRVVWNGSSTGIQKNNGRK